MRTGNQSLKLLLVEDDIDVAAGIGDYLAAHGVEVDFACDAAQAHARLRDDTFDVVVLDVGLPDQDGLSLCHSLKREGGLRSPVLFLTARDALDDKLQGFAAGATDYMVKPFAPAELLARVRAIAAHVPAAGGGALLRVGAYALDLQGRTLARADRHLTLHAAGFVLLRRLMQASPGSVSRSALCELLWEGDVPESDPLRMHIYQLRRSLTECFGVELIETVRGIGYRFAVQDDGTSA